MKRQLCLWFTIGLMLWGCSSAPKQHLDKIIVGMDKGEVLEAAGNPRRTFREKSRDHWVYIFYINDSKALRVVVFEGGRVIQVNTPAAKDPWESDLESAETFEEFEAKARARQKARP